MLSTVVSFLAGGLFDLLAFLASLLPVYEAPDIASQLTSSGAADWFAYLNWFVPVGSIVTVTTAWAAAIVFYNAYKLFSGWFRTFKS